MLVELAIEGFALIDSIRIELAESLNVFSGETGVGKSMLIDALNVVLGARSSSDLIRKGHDTATVSALFELHDAALLKEVCRVVDLPVPEDGQLLIRRTISRQGRSRGSINGQPVTAAMLKEAGNHIVDIHGQFDQQELLRPAGQLDILDAFGDLHPRRRTYAEAFKAHRELLARRDRLQQGRAERQRRRDYLAFQLEEIDALDVSADEMEQLKSKVNRLAHAERIVQAAGSVCDTLYDGDGAVAEVLGGAEKLLEEVADCAPELREATDRLADLQANLQDIVETVREFTDAEEFDPDEIERAQARLAAVQRTGKKYGGSVEAMLAERERIAEELAGITGDDSALEGIEQELARLQAEAVRLGADLHKARQDAGAKLATRVNRSLKDLGMSEARFSVGFDGTPGQTLERATAAGLTPVEFMIRTNPGEPAGALGRIASGGELSRVMLALKEIVARSDRTSVLVFDEIDSNVGPRLGSVIADKLEAIGASHQVICITHLGQIAARGIVQFKVRKVLANKRTAVSVDRLSGKDRLREIAEMLGGPDYSEHSLHEAEALLGSRALSE